MDLVSSDGEVGAQAGGCDRLLTGAGTSREGRGDVHGLALSGSGGVEVFPDAFGVDEPGDTPAAVATAAAVMGCPALSMALTVCRTRRRLSLLSLARAAFSAAVRSVMVVIRSGWRVRGSARSVAMAADLLLRV